MVHLTYLAYLVALQQWTSSHISYPCPSKAVQDLADIPGWKEEARWRILGESVGVGGAKKRNLVCNIPYKHITYHIPTPGPGTSVEVEKNREGVDKELLQARPKLRLKDEALPQRTRWTV